MKKLNYLFIFMALALLPACKNRQTSKKGADHRRHGRTGGWEPVRARGGETPGRGCHRAG